MWTETWEPPGSCSSFYRKELRLWLPSLSLTTKCRSTDKLRTFPPISRVTGNVILFLQARKWCRSDVSSLSAVSSLRHICLLQVTNSNFSPLQRTKQLKIPIWPLLRRSLGVSQDTVTLKQTKLQQTGCVVFFWGCVKCRCDFYHAIVVCIKWWFDLFLKFTFNYMYVSVWVCACEHRCLWRSEVLDLQDLELWGHPTWALGAKFRSAAGAVIAFKVVGHLSNSKVIIL